MEKIISKPSKIETLSFWNRSKNNTHLNFSLKSDPVIVAKFEDFLLPNNFSIVFNSKTTSEDPNTKVFLSINFLNENILKKLIQVEINQEYKQNRISIKNFREIFTNIQNHLVFVFIVDSNSSNGNLIIDDLVLEYTKEN